MSPPTAVVGSGDHSTADTANTHSPARAWRSGDRSAPQAPPRSRCSSTGCHSACTASARPNFVMACCWPRRATSGRARTRCGSSTWAASPGLRASTTCASRDSRRARHPASDRNPVNTSSRTWGTTSAVSSAASTSSRSATAREDRADRERAVARADQCGERRAALHCAPESAALPQRDRRRMLVARPVVPLLGDVGGDGEAARRAGRRAAASRSCAARLAREVLAQPASAERAVQPLERRRQSAPAGRRRSARSRTRCAVTPRAAKSSSQRA